MRKLIYILSFVLISLSLQAKEGEVLVATVDEGIGSFTAEYFETVIAEGEEDNYDAVMFKLNTPGGLLDATRDIVSSLLSADVPTIVYVSPSGSRAGSAGVFITMAANVAVMAPGTNIGAAHPVGMGGESGDSSDVMTQKVTNDASAFIRSIAQKRNRNQQFAEETVRQSSSVSEEEALEKNAINYIAKTEQEILELVSGDTAEIASGEIVLDLKDSKIIYREKDWKESLMTFLSDPNIAYIFILLAMYGILIELYNPGSIFPGTIGVISAILAGYSLQMLPVNYAGLALILVAAVLFILEVKITSYGLLSIGGGVAFILGSIMLIDAPGDFMDISLSIIITAAVFTFAVFFGIVYMALKAQKSKRVNGPDGLVGEKGQISKIMNNGMYKIKTHGELWTGKSDEQLEVGDIVKIVSVSGLKIQVEKDS